MPVSPAIAGVCCHGGKSNHEPVPPQIVHRFFTFFARFGRLSDGSTWEESGFDTWYRFRTPSDSLNTSGTLVRANYTARGGR